ncbi:hypothetical protein JCM21900_004216 [Sporobolomyces salmonicolor]
MSLAHSLPGTRTRTLSHLLLAGHNPLSPPSAYGSSSSSRLRQSPSNPTLTPVPLSAWLCSVGREPDAAAGYRLLPRGVAAGAGHSLLAYRNYEGVDRLVAVGRNEVGQLGVGFASQEGTRGLVEGFEGEAVLAAKAGVQSSYLLVEEDRDTTSLYSMGNLARGRLGHPQLFPPSTPLEPHVEPTQHLLPRATLVPVPPEVGRIKQLEVGFEHLLVLSESGEIWGTGCNTDGQLGLGTSVLSDVYELTKLLLPPEIVEHEGGVARISAGADTSALITQSGKVYTWGNSEYAQAFHGGKIDQIHSPLLIAHECFLPPSRRIVDFQCGGSFALALDDRSDVYSCGFGALGLTSSRLSTLTPTRIDPLSGQGVTRIRARFGYAAAVRDAGPASAIWTWGLNNLYGRLGVGSVGPARGGGGGGGGRFDPAAPPRVQMHVYEPSEVEVPLRALGLDRAPSGASASEWRFGAVELGEEGMWVALEVDEPEVD